MEKIEQVFPFLWLKGEDETLIKQEIGAIYESGLRAFCVESRVHADFCGERWFADMQIVLEEAKKRGMQVWLLDDKSYPTGIANGIIAKKYPELRGWQIVLKFVDIAGAVKNAKLSLPFCPQNNDQLLGAFICKRMYDDIVFSSMKEITGQVQEGTLYVDIPYGSYRVFFLYKSQGFAERNNYVDMMNPVSASKLIEAVYEPHYQHFKDYFGETFVGFFSDEPRLCNGMSDPLIFRQPPTFCGLGIKGLSYPYCDELVDEIGVKNPAEWIQIWFDTKTSADFRCRYMDAITKRYSKNFNQALSTWCHERGVLYSGHIIEDSGAHLRTVCSTGHYFRAMEGADISGVDVVLHQIKPYETDNCHYGSIGGGYGNPRFFNYTLAKLASSSANLDEKKQGRALCEAFGAYGWGESTIEMLYIANHMLSRGINYFIPHAFSMVDNDMDCPPHFYMGGKNPAYKGYGVLFRYINQLCGLLSGGKSFSEVGVLYHDEAEWSGKDHLPCDVVNKALTERQIDFDIIWREVLEGLEEEQDGLSYNGRKYQYIIVPSAEFLTEKTLSFLKKIGGRVVFTGKTPADFGQKVPLKQLAEFLFANGVKQKTQAPCKGLRIYKYQKDGKQYTLLFNEYGKRISFRFKEQALCYGYDAMEQRAYRFEAGEEITLEPAQAILIGEFAEKMYEDRARVGKRVRFAKVFLRGRKEQEFVFYKNARLPFDINTLEERYDFCGDIRYQFTVDLTKSEELFIAYRGEYCEVEIDGEKVCSIGGRLSVDTSRFTGEKKVLVTIANTLTYEYTDNWSHYAYRPSACVDKILY